MAERPDVLVVGAGVIGLTCAVALSESGAKVEVRADTIPGTTSLAAGALWGPYLVEPRDRVREWALRSYAVFAELAHDPSTGVRMTAGIEASRMPASPPDFTDMVPDLAVLSADQLPSGFVTGVRYTVPLIDMPIYLRYLRDRLESAGGRIREGHFGSLDAVAAQAPLVVNATGLGARSFVPDPSVYPIRGQLLVVENPGLREWFSEDTGASQNLTHWYPHGDALVLGGQAAPEDSSIKPDSAIANGILERCAAIEPRIADSRILGHRVGLRPTRAEIRLETQRIGAAQVVHCYGHGGAGATLSWGCANEVLDIL